jgi:hypothetical protein
MHNAPDLLTQSPVFLGTHDTSAQQAGAVDLVSKGRTGTKAIWADGLAAAIVRVLNLWTRHSAASQFKNIFPQSCR